MKTTAIVAAAMLATLLALYTWRTETIHAGKQSVQPQTTASASVPALGSRQSAATPAVVQPAGARASVNPGPAEVVEQKSRPFSIGGKEFTSILRKQLPAGAKPGEGLTVISMEIRDAAGAPQFSRDFANEGGTDGFITTVSVSVIPLSGATGNGLLVAYSADSEPSAPEPESSGWWQVLGMVDGKLKPFSGPLLVVGDLLPADASNRALAPGSPIAAPGDVLQFKVWAGRFRLVFPIRIDWAQGKLAPAQPCEASGAAATACDYAVVPEDQRYGPELTFLRLCAAPEPCQKPERMVVKKDSKVELIAARAQVRFNPGKLSGWSGNPRDAMNDAGGIAILSQEPCLKVRIDGKEGWIYSQEDLDALGMPAEQ